MTFPTLTGKFSKESSLFERNAITVRDLLAVRMDCLQFLATNATAFSLDKDSLVPLAEQVFAFLKGDIEPTGTTWYPEGNVNLALRCLKMATEDEYKDSSVLEKAKQLYMFAIPPNRPKSETPSPKTEMAPPVDASPVDASPVDASA